MNSVPCLLSLVLLALVLPEGNSLKCYLSQCTNMTVPGSPEVRTCDERQREITCPLGYDRCMTMRSKINIRGVIADAEMRNCTLSVLCNSAACNAANATGAVVECQIGCCEGDLCNTGGPITTQVPPTGGGPSGADLSCYSCASANFHNISDVELPKADCKKPAEQTCGPDIIPGTKQNRCVRIKLQRGDQEYEMRNCSGPYFCNAALVCANANKTGDLSACSVACCQGKLCNGDKAPEGSSSTLTGTLTCVLVMLAGVIVLLADMI